MSPNAITHETPRDSHGQAITTARLTLRAPRMADAGAVAKLAADRRVAENAARLPHPYDISDAEAFIAGARTGNELVFAISSRADAALIGMCSLAGIDGKAPELGYWLGVPHWGQGYATEAARALVDHAFRDLGCEALRSAARVSNPASRRVLEKCGFQWTSTGLLRFAASRSSAPIDRFRLDRNLWASLKSWGAADGWGR